MPRSSDESRAAHVLCVGVLDPVGRDGLAIDARTCASLGTLASLVPTSIRTRRGHGLGRDDLESESVLAQLDAASTMPVDACKLAVEGDEGVIRAVAEYFEDAGEGPNVVDLHFVDRSGDTLLAQAAIDALRENLLRHGTLVVANLDEAAALTGRRGHDVSGQKEVARRIADLGVERVLITGGRTEGHAIDLLYDGSGFIEFGDDRVALADPRQLRGAGATLCTTIACVLARGRPLLEAVDLGRRVVQRAIKDAHPTRWGLVCDPMAPRYRALEVDMTPVQTASVSGD